MTKRLPKAEELTGSDPDIEHKPSRQIVEADELLAEVQRLREELTDMHDQATGIADAAGEAVEALKQRLALYEPPEPRDETLVCRYCGDLYPCTNAIWHVRSASTNRWRYLAAERIKNGA